MNHSQFWTEDGTKTGAYSEVTTNTRATAVGPDTAESKRSLPKAQAFLHASLMYTASDRSRCDMDRTKDIMTEIRERDQAIAHKFVQIDRKGAEINEMHCRYTQEMAYTCFKLSLYHLTGDAQFVNGLDPTMIHSADASLQLSYDASKKNPLWFTLAAFTGVYHTSDLLAGSVAAGLTLSALGQTEMAKGFLSMGLEQIDGIVHNEEQDQLDLAREAYPERGSSSRYDDRARHRSRGPERVRQSGREERPIGYRRGRN